MNTATILSALIQNETTVEKVKARVKDGKIDALDAIDAIQQFEQSKKAPAGAERGLSVKTSVASTEKGKERKGGCVCVYGLNSRMPVSVYANGWLKLAEFLPEVLTHIATTSAWSVKPNEDRAGIQQRAKQFAEKFSAALK